MGKHEEIALEKLWDYGTRLHSIHGYAMDPYSVLTTFYNKELYPLIYGYHEAFDSVLEDKDFLQLTLLPTYDLSASLPQHELRRQLAATVLARLHELHRKERTRLLSRGKALKRFELVMQRVEETLESYHRAMSPLKSALQAYYLALTAPLDVRDLSHVTNQVTPLPHQRLAELRDAIIQKGDFELFEEFLREAAPLRALYPQLAEKLTQADSPREHWETALSFLPEEQLDELENQLHALLILATEEDKRAMIVAADYSV